MPGTPHARTRSLTTSARNPAARAEEPAPRARSTSDGEPGGRQEVPTLMGILHCGVSSLSCRQAATAESLLRTGQCGAGTGVRAHCCAPPLCIISCSGMKRGRCGQCQLTEGKLQPNTQPCQGPQHTCARARSTTLSKNSGYVRPALVSLPQLVS